MYFELATCQAECIGLVLREDKMETRRICRKDVESHLLGIPELVRGRADP